MAKLISKTYGEALYELAIEENKVDVLFDEVSDTREVIVNNEEFTKFMNNPNVTKEEKLDVLEKSFKGRVSDDMTGFLELIADKGRFGEIISILDFFIAAVKEQKKIGTAYITTAMPMTEIQKSQLVKRLLETTKYETMEMNYDVEEDLIGGMVIRIGDRVVDSSVKSKLYELTKELQKIQLN